MLSSKFLRGKIEAQACTLAGLFEKAGGNLE